MNDLDLFDEGPAEEKPRRGRLAAAADSQRRRKVLLVGGLAAVVILGIGVWYGVQSLFGLTSYEDFEGAGDSDVVVKVEPGTISQTGQSLMDAGVVASVRAYTAAAQENESAGSVQPGYYVLKTKMSGANAIAGLVRKNARVGEMEIRGGFQLDDVTVASGKVNQGIISLIAKASCAELNGKNTCLTAEQVRTAMEKADLAELGAPEWVITEASKATEPRRRFEGLLMPGKYDVKPGETPENVLRALLTTASARLQAAGLPKSADKTGFSPYQLLVMASLVEKEAATPDFGKIAQVTRNRLAIGMRLQYDSTVNYPLDRPNIRTNSADRDKAGAYNTYAVQGLPPTPIGSPSAGAISSAITPEPSDYLYFVRCDKQGKSCFAKDLDDHNANVRAAQAKGAY
ncbi:endolytic transglycosylase MltG [Allokutzneria sp. A3M-2-11 16]|uniref:endolytic transglycosylase MltG n=1 Tax=Allokutzneria sp. A3M-2-11 16 TaxID=2962043 RepID=UPI0020B83B9F|nr:endolytic transglycosylase MltG [Allokutzneria sp. A3M-2-11 16]MCP3801257.1 endolytic transglycosylase MltG [Allokutzneria sp. A3M-2-11 16]